MEQLVKLVGIARQAAEGKLLAEKRRVEYRTLPTRKWLNRCDSQRVPFDWTINPYRGCEYGCKYCFARFTHEFLERRDPALFETEIYAKVWDQRSFRHEMAALRSGDIIGIGTATDPYQPAERNFGLTRQVLDSLRTARGICVFVTTKSNLITRDIDALKTLAEHNQVHVTLTITTLDRKLARLTEPFAPRPDLRIEAVARLADAGVPVGVIANPILPLLTDSEENLEAVASAAKRAGAVHFSANLLFLTPSIQRVFFPFIEDRFPHLLKRYERSYASGAYLKGVYPERMHALVQDIRARVGIAPRDMQRIPPPAPLPQMTLFAENFAAV